VLDSIPLVLPEWETEVQSMPGFVHGLKTLSRLSLVGGNSVETLRNGDETMPAMLEAIRSANSALAKRTRENACDRGNACFPRPAAYSPRTIELRTGYG
jgi:hypothetical protein